MEGPSFLEMIGFLFAAAGRNRRNPESSSSSSSGFDYEVFLSFRGKDTRGTIADQLYTRLVDAGIQVFRDDEELPAGEDINKNLIDAIKESKISIAVLSKDYASSKSCLMEVVQMWECSISNGQIIIPIFYDISPSDVENQAGHFETSFKKHEEDGVNSNTIQRWKEVFRRIVELRGFDRENINGRRDSQLVEKVLRRVWQVLKKDDQVVTDKLVGIDPHVQEMMRKLSVVYSNRQAIEVCGGDVRIVKIWGMPGVGKTTLAQVVYNKIHTLFDACCFLEGINSRKVELSREKLIASLQKRNCEMISSFGDGIKQMRSQFKKKKVLIVLDDVHKDEQIEALAGNHTWFGPGSRIIVITNIRSVLNGYEGGAVEEYIIEPMRDHHALQLFRKHAFREGAPQAVSEFDSLSIDIVKALGGIPMAIVLRARYLKKKNSIEIWRNSQASLYNHPDEERVEAALNASYNYLDDNTKKIFLDIACFFIAKDERIPYYMWEACNYDPHRGIDFLRDLHLLEDGENNELRMHHLIRDFGRAIVERIDRSQRCRFWNNSDARSILEDRKGTGNVQGICLAFEEGSTVCFKCEAFKKISNLRYLRLDQANIQGDAENLLPNLRWLDWQACHLISELRIMHLEELVILDLSWSPVTKCSPDREQIMKKVEKLKVLNLQGCVQLRATLDFPAPANLEMLILEGCTLLTQIKPFIRDLKNLRSLNLKDCTRVNELPRELYHMTSLKELLIDGTGIKKIYCQSGSLPNLETLSARDCKFLQDISTIGRLGSLSSLALDRADISGLPDAFKFPQTLKRLSLRECRKLVKLPHSIRNLKVLEVMDLSETAIDKLPSSVEELTELKTLKMAFTRLEKFPEDIGKLTKLEEIDFSYCRDLKGEVRCDLSKLHFLRILKLLSSSVTKLPPSICHLSRLQALDILDCKQLNALPNLPPSLLCLRWESKKMRLSDLSYLTNLRELRLTDGEQPKAGWFMVLLKLMTPNIGWITRLTNLETLELSLSKVTHLPRNFSALTQLRELSLSYMEKLDLTQLPSTSNLSALCLKHCKIQKPKFSSLEYLSELELEDCDLAEIDGLENLELLEVLTISHCSSLTTNLNGLKEMRRFRKVEVISSPLVVIPQLSESVEKARID